MLEHYFTKLFLFHFLELLAAVVGLYFLRRCTAEKGDKIFVWFLWYVFIVETINLYPAFAYYEGYEFFSFLKESPFRRNYWIANPNVIIINSFYCYYFILHLTSVKFRKAFQILLITYIATSLLNLLVTNVYFYAYSQYSTIVGAILLTLIIGFYWYELLLSNKILYSFKSLAFYVSFIALIWHLATTPLFIYSFYYNTERSVEFVQMYRIILISLNVFMYLGYIISFLILSRKRRLERSFSG